MIGISAAARLNPALRFRGIFTWAFFVDDEDPLLPSAPVGWIITFAESDDAIGWLPATSRRAPISLKVCHLFASATDR